MFLKRVVNRAGLAGLLFLALPLSPAGNAKAGESVIGQAEEVLERLENPALETTAEPAEKPEAAPEKPPAEAKAETPEEAAARVEAEHKEKREQERRELLATAEKFIETADETLLTKLPYPLDLLFGVRLFNITLWRYLAGFGVMALGVFLIYIVSWRFRKVARRIKDGDSAKGRPWSQALDVAVLALRNPAKILLFALVIRAVSSLLVTPYHPDIVEVSNLLAFLSGVMYLYILVGIVDKVYGDRLFHGSDRLMDTVRPMLLKLVRFFIILVAALNIYQDLTGQTMFSIIAGLGIGGLALALASQETLKNLLGFAAIAMDKSFFVGDAVNIDSHLGTVEHVGLRSTELRGFDGNRIVIPNSTAMNSNIVNLARRPFIRKEIRIALSTLNPFEKIEAAMEGIREVVGEHQGKIAGLPPVVRFVDFEPARFIIQVYFWYDSNQPFFFDECSRVNLEICRKLSQLGVMYAER